MSSYHVPPADGLLKLDAMENPYPWPVALIDEWLELLRVTGVNRYPDPDAGKLKDALRVYLDLPAGTDLMLGNGSDEIILILCLALAEPNRAILAPDPSFSMYRVVAEMTGFDFVGVPLREDDFSLDLEEFLSVMESQQPALVFLASPNNPTGNLIADETVEEIAGAAPGLVVLDEAYGTFAQKSMMGMLERHKNVVVMQTLSKLGLAGLRLGLVAGPAAWLAEFNKIRLPYNVNVLTQVSATFVLEHIDILEAQTAQIRRDRESVYEALQRKPQVQVWPSHANFLTFRTLEHPATAVHARLKAQGVLAKCLHGVHPLLADCLRVSIGTPDENAAFLGALDDALGPAVYTK